MDGLMAERQDKDKDHGRRPSPGPGGPDGRGLIKCPHCGRLVAPQGGASKTLVARSVVWLFGWSPDGRQIAFQGPGGWLDVVDVATGKVRKLLQLRFAPNVVWSPSSQELLVKTQPLRQNRCASLWRVPAGGGKPQLLRNC